jgi:hypothetical protein
MSGQRAQPFRRSGIPAGLSLAVLVSVLSPSAHALSAQGAAASPSETSDVYALRPVTDGVQMRTPDGRVMFEYLTRKPAGASLTGPSAACFHPFNTPSGERVTALGPDDHPHHRGVYLAWHDSEFREPITPRGETSALFGWNITKADFWGWGVYAPSDGRVIQTTDVRLVSADANRAQIEIRNDWNVGRRKMLDEVTSAIASERNGVFLMDLTFRLTPVADYQLNKQSFSGFNFQARKDGESHFTNSAGEVQLRDPHYSVPELNWPPSPWYGYVIATNEGKTVGAVVIDHPSNPPSTWHNSRSLWMLNPVIAALHPYTIRAGETLTLRYRVITHDGPTPTAVVDALSTEFRATN